LKKKEPREIFSLSFLDIMSCGFGAIVLILLISQFQTNEVIIEDNNIPSIESLENDIKKSNVINYDLISTKEKLEKKLANISNDLINKKQKLTNISSIATSKIEKNSELSELIKPIEEKNIKLPAKEAGGLNVDAEYVVFIIDNSGSMVEWGPWSSVIKEISNIIDAFPDLKGFQILNDQGAKMVSGSSKWIIDSAANRKLIKTSIKKFTGISRSNPIPGLKIALNRYANGIDKVGIFIVGDDITLQTGERTETIYKDIQKLNRIGNKIKARINGLVFLTSRNSTMQYRAASINQNVMFLNFINELSYTNMGSVVVAK
tara:strand:- start:1222 stop:2175 length:954 start_codon:yes stop_codon:yes gene_type:complete